MIFYCLCVRSRQERKMDSKEIMHKIAVVIPKYGLTGGAEQFASELTGRLSLSTSYHFHVYANQWKNHPCR